MTVFALPEVVLARTFSDYDGTDEAIVANDSVNKTLDAFNRVGDGRENTYSPFLISSDMRSCWLSVSD